MSLSAGPVLGKVHISQRVFGPISRPVPVRLLMKHPMVKVVLAFRASQFNRTTLLRWFEYFDPKVFHHHGANASSASRVTSYQPQLVSAVRLLFSEVVKCQSFFR